MPNLIQANKLTLGYDELVIKEASFAFKDDDFVFITGKSGSGKSTLLKSFYGDLEPISGKLEVCGSLMNKIGNLELLKLRQRIGIIFQENLHYQDLQIKLELFLLIYHKIYFVVRK